MSQVTCPKTTDALALQGGGALGSFQVGAYRAMYERDIEPTVIAGISIGAINAAIIAGNEPSQRVERLHSFWRAISRYNIPLPLPTELNYAVAHWKGFTDAMFFGQPGFFKPRLIPPQLALPGTEGATSYYDTSQLRQTILEHVNFDLINCPKAKIRLLIGAVKSQSGEMVFFDSREQAITVDHIMASGALPPGFPGVRINGELYWDGGLHSNTALDVILEKVRGRHVRIFLPTLFNPSGPEPRTMEEVERRLKEIQYGSHSRYHVDQAIKAHKLRRQLDRVLKHASPDLQSQLAEMWPMGRSHDLQIVHVEYKAPQYETRFNDADFSPVSLERRENDGYAQMIKATAATAD